MKSTIILILICLGSGCSTIHYKKTTVLPDKSVVTTEFDRKGFFANAVATDLDLEHGTVKTVASKESQLASSLLETAIKASRKDP